MSKTKPANVVPIRGGAVSMADAMPDFEALIPASVREKLDDPEFMAEQEREREAARLREVAAEARRRLDVMRRHGAPRRAVESVGRGGLDDTLAMAAIADWSGEGLLVLAGGVGCGKTTAAVWWLSRYGGTEPLFIRAGALEAAGRYDKPTRELWRSASALCIDDVGAEYADGKGNWLSLLDEIIDYYHGEMRPLIMTTNIDDEKKFRARMGERIESRVREDRGWCPIGGDDLRSVR